MTSSAPARAHLLDRPLEVAGLDVDAADRVLDDRHVETRSAPRRARCSSRSSRSRGPRRRRGRRRARAARRRGCRRGRPSSPACCGSWALSTTRSTFDRSSDGWSSAPGGALHAVDRPDARRVEPSHFSGSTSTPSKDPWSRRVPVARRDHEVEAVRDRVDRRPAISSPRSTGSAPPGVKSFWKSTISRASTPRIFAPGWKATGRLRSAAGRAAARPRGGGEDEGAGQRQGGRADPALPARTATCTRSSPSGTPTCAATRARSRSRAAGATPTRSCARRRCARPRRRSGCARERRRDRGRAPAHRHVRHELRDLSVRRPDRAGRRASARTRSRSTRSCELSLPDLVAGYERKRLIRRGVPIKTDTYTVGGHLIWGATARILAGLLERLKPILRATVRNHRDFWLRNPVLYVLLDRHRDHVAPLGPRAVVVLDVVDCRAARAARTRCGPSARRSGSRRRCRCRPARPCRRRAPQVVGGLEGAVLVDGLRPRDAGAPGMCPARCAPSCS